MAPKKKLKFFNKGHDEYFSESNNPQWQCSSSLEEYGAEGREEGAHGGEGAFAGPSSEKGPSMEAEYDYGPSCSSHVSSQHLQQPQPPLPPLPPLLTFTDAHPPQKKKKQQCRLCANHNLNVDMKGHKHFCPYTDCTCEFCEITKMRQLYMKKQQQITRKQQQEQQQQMQFQGISPGSSGNPFGQAGPSSEDFLDKEFPPQRKLEMERDLANIDDEPLLEKINKLCRSRGGKRH